MESLVFLEGGGVRTYFLTTHFCFFAKFSDAVFRANIGRCKDFCFFVNHFGPFWDFESSFLSSLMQLFQKSDFQLQPLAFAFLFPTVNRRCSCHSPNLKEVNVGFPFVRFIHFLFFIFFQDRSGWGKKKKKSQKQRPKQTRSLNFLNAAHAGEASES